jgi:hypothetical protein
MMKDGFSYYFCRLIGYLRRADYGFAMQSPDCKHEIWWYFGTFVSVPRQCKSKHTANAILRAAKIPMKY